MKRALIIFGIGVASALLPVVPCRAQAPNLKFKDVPVYWNQWQLPRHFEGQDPAFIWSNASLIYAPKTEFQTTKEWNQLLWLGKNAPIIGNLKITDYFACTLRETGIGEMGLPFYTYDADAQLVTAHLHPCTEYNTSANQVTYRLCTTFSGGDSYVGENGFGATANVDRFDANDYDLQFTNLSDFMGYKDGDQNALTGEIAVSTYLSSAIADSEIGNIRVLALFKLCDPYYGYWTNFHEATIDSPSAITDVNHVLVAHIDELWFYDYETGKVLKKVKPFPAPAWAQ